MQRRDLFKLSLGAALARGADPHKFFTAEEYALVDELTEGIIPADEVSGGARAAKVADFIDQRLAEAFDSSERDMWRRQLASIGKAQFKKPELRMQSVSQLPFFEKLKEMTVRGYYTSKIGIHDDQRYLGNTYQQGEYAGFLPPIHEFPEAPRERLAVASYPFRKVVPLLEFPKMVADRYGLHAIEPLDEHFLSTAPEYLQQLNAALAASGSRVANIPVGRLGGSFYDADAAKRGQVVEKAKHWIDVAVALKSPSVRMHVGSAKNAPNVQWAAESLRQVAAYGETRNVAVHLENDDPKSEEAFFLIDVMNAAKSPWLRALPDFCNSMLLERGEDYNYKAVSAMFDQAWGICHVKDSEQDGKKMFHVDLKRTFEIAKNARFRGYYSMEFDAEGDPFAPTAKLIEASLGILA
jgi:sugar phosphate isomerase/epimerase